MIHRLEKFLKLAAERVAQAHRDYPWTEGLLNMPSDPRLATYWDELDAHFATILGDGTIVLPTLGAGGLVPSTSLKLAVALVNTGTNTPLAGLGASGNELFGKVKTVGIDGMMSVQDRGYMTFAFVATNPAPNVAVGVDGTGKVTQTAGNKQAVCVGYVVDPQSGNTVCLVKKN